MGYMRGEAEKECGSSDYNVTVKDADSSEVISEHDFPIRD